MPDNIEKILRELHIILSNSESYNGSETEVIVNKRAVFDQLEKLNYAVMEVMDMYEANELSKEQAINRVKKDAQKIIDDADKSAEEIYAASLIYTDDALNELRDVMGKLRTNVVKEYDKLVAAFDSQMNNITKNRDELHMKLSDLSSGNEYLNIIVDEKKRREKERDRYNKVSDGEIKDESASRLSKYAEIARERKGSFEDASDYDRGIGSAEVVVNVNTNHPAFKKENKSEEDLDNLLHETKRASQSALSDNREYPASKDKGNVDVKETFLGKFFKLKDEDDN